MFASSIHLFLGAERLLQAELKDLGFESIPKLRGVLVIKAPAGMMSAVYKINYQSRVGMRVLWKIAYETI